MNETLSAFDLLENDFQGQGLKKIQDALLTMKQKIRTAMDQGLSQEDFAKAKTIDEAIGLCEETVVRLHEKMTR